MAIPDNYIDKITKGNDSRMISPAADMVRVNNDNFDGETLDEVLDDVYSKSEVDTKVAEAGSGAVSVTTNQDGTFVIHVGETDYTINLNHTHENMAKIEKCVGSNLPSPMEDDTIYVQVNNLTTPTEIESIYFFGLEFVGGGGTPGVPRLVSPQSGSTIDVGINEGSGVSVNVTVKGYDLTESLTVAVSGTGFSVDVNSITANEARLGKTITITYSGTNPNATGTLLVSSNEVSSQCDLEADYQAMPAGYTRLQYISEITNRIDTSINSAGTTWVLDAQCSSQKSYTEVLVGYGLGAGQYAGGLIDGYWGVGAGNDQHLPVSKTTRATAIVSFTTDGVTMTIGEDTVTRATSSASSGNISLFGQGQPYYNVKGNIYSVKCTAGASFNGIPAERDSDNKQGIYDLANDVFYPLK